MNITLELTHIGFGNERLEVVATPSEGDQLMPEHHQDYKLDGGCTAWVAYHPDSLLAHFMIETPNKNGGICSMVTTVDGEKKEVRNAWSSNAKHISKVVGALLIDGTLRTQQGDQRVAFNAKKLAEALYISVEELEDVLDRHDRIKSNK